MEVDYSKLRELNDVFSHIRKVLFDLTDMKADYLVVKNENSKYSILENIMFAAQAIDEHVEQGLSILKDIS